LLGAIEETIAWVLDLFKHYYNVRDPYQGPLHKGHYGPQVYLKITVILCGHFSADSNHILGHFQERNLYRGINIGSFDLRGTHSDEVADVATRHLAAWLDSNRHVEVSRSFQLRKDSA
jgi:hypothetical protein